MQCIYSTESVKPTIVIMNVIYSSERLVYHFLSDTEEYENEAKPQNGQILVNIEMHANKAIFKSFECKISTNFQWRNDELGRAFKAIP